MTRFMVPICAAALACSLAQPCIGAEPIVLETEEPMVLETPKGKEMREDRRNLAVLRALRGRSSVARALDARALFIN